MKNCAAATALLLALTATTLAACGQSAENAAAAGDKYAGLDAEIRTWRESLLTSAQACAKAPADKACQNFAVACKGELSPAPEEAAKGVMAKIVVAMTYDGWEPATSEFKPGSAFARFSRTSEGWTRAETTPVNLSTCAAS